MFCADKRHMRIFSASPTWTCNLMPSAGGILPTTGFAGIDTFSTHPASIEQEFQCMLKGLNGRIAHRSDGKGADDGGFKIFLANYNAFYSSLKISARGAPNSLVPVAKRLAAKLLDHAERGHPVFQEKLDELFNTRQKFENLYLVVRHINLLAGSRLRVKRGEDASVQVSIRQGHATPDLKVAYDKLKDALFEHFKGTIFLCKVLEEIERYADSFAAQPYAWRVKHEVNRVLFFASLFAEISMIYRTMGVSVSDNPEPAEKIFQRFIELEKVKKLERRQIRCAWQFSAELFKDKLSMNIAFEMLKHYYECSDEEFDSLMQQMPKRYHEATYTFLIDKMGMYILPNTFKAVVEELGRNYKAADRAFRKAAKLLNVERTPELADKLVKRIAAMAESPSATGRSKYEMAEMIAWRIVISAADLSGCNWEILKKALAGAYGISNEEAGELFAEVDNEEYRLDLARHVLKKLDVIKCYAHPSLVKDSIIDHKAERLKNAVARTKRMLLMFPNGDKVSDEEIIPVVAAMLIRLVDIAFDDREAVRAIKKLKGDGFLLNGFSQDAAVAVKRLGIEDYFGWFYPQVHGLPQALIEANVGYLGGSAHNIGRNSYFCRSKIHASRAERFKKILATVDERLAHEKELKEEEKAKIRQEAIERLATMTSGIKRFSDGIARKLNKWLSTRIKEKCETVQKSCR